MTKDEFISKLKSELYCEPELKINGIQPLVFRKHKCQEKNKVGPINQYCHPSTQYVKDCLNSLINLDVDESFENTLIKITKIRDFENAHLKGVKLQKRMWGEYPPSLVATYGGISFSMVDENRAEIDTDDFLTPLLPIDLARNGSTTSILSKGDLHNTWLSYTGKDDRIILAQYSAKLEAFLKDNEKTFIKWANETLKLKDSKPETVTFMLWLRCTGDIKHSHNMSQEIFCEIFTALGHICRSVYPELPVHILLMGDNVANVGDLRASTKKPDKKMAKNSTIKAIELLLGKGIRSSITDLRCWYTKVDPVATISQQYAFHRYLKNRYQPKFIIGVESGNLDGFGYSGIPVISIDPTDKVESLPLNIIDDRIGNYTLMTPNWQLVNYGKGDNDDLFRRYLYGAMLTFTFYRGILEYKELTESEKQTKLFECLLETKSTTLSKSEKSSESGLTVINPKDGAPLKSKTTIAGDGNCLFRAFSQAMVGNQDDHGYYRQRAAEYVLNHCTDTEIKAALDYDRTTYRNTMPYIVTTETKNSQAHWGSALELNALAKHFHVTVHLHYDYEFMIVFGNQGRVIELRYVNGNHYEVI